jgi:hypothetical protein
MFDNEGRNMATGSTASAESKISVNNLGGEAAGDAIGSFRSGAAPHRQS